MSDLIDRQEALDALERSKKTYFDRQVIIGAMKDIVRNLPSAQPETHDERTETHACDLISRAEAIDALGERPMVWAGSDYELGARNQYDADVLALETVPSAQPERKKGKWVKEYWNGEHTRKCSACNITQTVTTYRGKVNFSYCPYCGADMRGEQDGRDS